MNFIEFCILEIGFSAIKLCFLEEDSLAEFGVYEVSIFTIELGRRKAGKAIIDIAEESSILKAGFLVAEFGTLKAGTYQECCILERGITAVEFSFWEVSPTLEFSFSKVNISTVKHSAREVCFAAEFRTGKMCVSA